MNKIFKLFEKKEPLFTFWVFSVAPFLVIYKNIVDHGRQNTEYIVEYSRQEVECMNHETIKRMIFNQHVYEDEKTIRNNGYQKLSSILLDNILL